MVLGSWNPFISLLSGDKHPIYVGSLFQTVAYCLEALALPFPVFVFGYAVNGVGSSLQVHSLIYQDYRSMHDTVVRTHKPMDSLQVSRTMHLQKWGCCTQHTACSNHHDLWTLSWHFILFLRCWCSSFTAGCNAVCSNGPVVISLPRVSWYCYHKHDRSHSYLRPQIPRR